MTMLAIFFLFSRRRSGPIELVAKLSVRSLGGKPP